MPTRASSEVTAGSSSEPGEKRVRRRRVQLSCSECRSKKLSCDRNWPCQRCIKSGRGAQCSYETPTGQPPVPNVQQQQQLQQPPPTPLTTPQESSDEILHLRAEVDQLRHLLSQRGLQHDDNSERGSVVEPPGRVSSPLSPPPTLPVTEGSIIASPHSVVAATRRPDHPKDRAPRGYYAQHSLFKYFVEIPELFPFISETAQEWLKPAGVRLNKPDLKSSHVESASLKALLPPKDDTDALVASYLDYFEQLHRIVHVPTFKKQYARFWLPGQQPSTDITALILAMVALSACASPVGARYRYMPARWIIACDEWLNQQSFKCHKLIQYQVACLVYLGKRMNMMHKKRFWSETCNLVQRAMIDGLHCDDLSSTSDGVYMVQMRRRIWSTICELDLQNSYEYGLPTLLHNIQFSGQAPLNIDDEDFDETSTEMPSPKAPADYTRASYQSLSSRSWALRVEISRRLTSHACSQALTYDDVMHYTQEVTQAIVDLPAWDSHSQRGLPLVANAFLQFQLKECILGLHRPYLGRDDPKFWLSENICHQISRDMLLLNRQLADLCLQSLVHVREDLLLAALNLTRVIMLQPLGSMSVTLSCADSSIELLERCLPILETRYLQSCNSEPWCFITMCAATMLLKVYLGKTDARAARYACGERFLDMHYKHCGRQQTLVSSQQSHQQQVIQEPILGASGPSTANPMDTWPTVPFENADVGSIPIGWPDTNAFDLGFESFDLMMGLQDRQDDVW